MLPSALLTAYADKFYGFGRWEAKVWFVGIEEAGGWEEQEVQRRLDAWKCEGGRELENAPSFYPASGNDKWHGIDATSQATWRQLIRMLLLARGLEDSEQAILEYQRTQWGATSGNTCLAELLPLPSPSTTQWRYGQWTGLPWLKSRHAYLSKVRIPRGNALRKMVNARPAPRAVIFYGLTLGDRTSLLPDWSRIAGGRFDQAIKDRKILLWRQTKETAFFVTRHPAAESDTYFREIGNFLRKTSCRPILTGRRYSMRCAFPGEGVNAVFIGWS